MCYCHNYQCVAGTTPESEFADRDVSYEVANVTTQVRINSSHIIPIGPSGDGISSSEDVVDSVFSTDELTKSGLLAGECTGTGIVSMRGVKSERPLSSHFPLDMPGLNKQFIIPSFATDAKETSSQNTLENRHLILDRINIPVEGTNNEKVNIKCEDYGFKIFSIGSPTKTSSVGFLI